MLRFFRLLLGFFVRAWRSVAVFFWRAQRSDSGSPFLEGATADRTSLPSTGCFGPLHEHMVAGVGLEPVSDLRPGADEVSPQENASPTLRPLSPTQGERESLLNDDEWRQE